ncbi:hypothetical protein B8V81_3545 [Paenibacillus pasadenensis]|uniref:Uncharacterized protein n=1 Tax=Paenibacillus pasadenensis TaxID=217090 RepID=A0A2N5N438_9BACL|nr:hypothetical protein B8V81_3545 [Paenibacillus pasadenensis]
MRIAPDRPSFLGTRLASPPEDGRFRFVRREPSFANRPRMQYTWGR